jgi:hypothetical protein
VAVVQRRHLETTVLHAELPMAHMAPMVPMVVGLVLRLVTGRQQQRPDMAVMELCVYNTQRGQNVKRY